MNTQNQKKSPIILIISLLVILVAAVFLVQTFFAIDTKYVLDEIPVLLVHGIVFIPAILGIWKFANQPTAKSTLIGFAIYGLLTIGGYVNVLLADDPLAAGLPMVVIVIPYALFFTLFLIKKLKTA